MDDRIPFVATYRGIEIHDFQPESRIEEVVKPEIDAVYLLTDPQKLVEYLGNSANPPEARLFAAARCNAAWEIATENREVRPRFDRDLVRAAVAGLSSRKWMDATRYTSLLDTGHRNAAPRASENFSFPE